MNLYTYVLAVDDGAAPNPYGGVCTLTICKPAIRKTAQVGDWIVGLGSANGPKGQDLSLHVVYAMEVSRKLRYEEYWNECTATLRSKIPVWERDAAFEHQVGDCIYEPVADGKFWQHQGVHKAGNYDGDVSGRFALLADERFFYFGDSPVRLPEEFEGMRHRTQGHKVHLNNDLKGLVVPWMAGGFGRGLEPRKLYGEPMHRHLVQPGNDRATWGTCGCHRMSSMEDDVSDVC
jgi:Nucleotide modification associated domain 2